MTPRPFTAISKPLSALIALLVALGTQVLLGNMVPASMSALPFGPSGGLHRIDLESLWVGDSVIRFLSFAMGGTVAVLLTRGLSRSLFGLLIAIAIIAAVFQQFPGRAVFFPLALWSLAGPLGIAIGAWAANARRSHFSSHDPSDA